MYPSTAEFKEALTKPHRMRSRIEVYDRLGGALLYESASRTLTHPEGIVEGEVSAADEAIRRRISFRVIDSSGDLTPAEATDVFTPWGHIVKAWRGIYLSDGSVEEKPLGVFSISDVEVNDPGANLQLICNAYDLAMNVERHKAINDIVFGAGANIVEAIEQLIRSTIVGLRFNFVSTPFNLATPVVIKVGDDRWKAAKDMAASIGCELFFDPDGVCTLRSIPNYSAAPPVWTYAEGSQATMLYLNKRVTNEEKYNYFIVTGEHANLGTPVRSDAFDNNPNSPTYVNGPYGVVVAPPVKSDFVGSIGQAAAAAQGMLQRSLGESERIHFNAIVNPAHEVGDVIHITRGKTHIDDNYVIQSLSIPLVYMRGMDVMTRKRVAS